MTRDTHLVVGCSGWLGSVASETMDCGVVSLFEIDILGVSREGMRVIDHMRLTMALGYNCLLFYYPYSFSLFFFVSIRSGMRPG